MNSPREEDSFADLFARWRRPPIESNKSAEVGATRATRATDARLPTETSKLSPHDTNAPGCNAGATRATPRSPSVAPVAQSEVTDATTACGDNQHESSDLEGSLHLLPLLPRENAIPGASSTDSCSHQSDDMLARWYRRHPELTCARCFYDGGEPLRRTIWDAGVANAWISRMFDELSDEYNGQPNVFTNNELRRANTAIDRAFRKKSLRGLLSAVQRYGEIARRLMGSSDGENAPVATQEI